MSNGSGVGARWRVNVLILMAMGYATVLLVFGGMAWSSTLTAEQAYDAVQAPLMALVGGSIAMAKDLLQLDKVGKKEEEAI